MPPSSTDIVSLRGWDNSGLDIQGCRFFGGIDGVHVKSSAAVMACTDFDVSPWQHYLEGASAPGKYFYRQ